MTDIQKLEALIKQHQAEITLSNCPDNKEQLEQMINDKMVRLSKLKKEL